MKKKIIIVLCVLVALGVYGKINNSEKKVSNTTIKETSIPIVSEETIETSLPTPSLESTTIRQEFKDAMDSYEEFMDEYVAFMKKYKENPSDVSLLMDYAKYVSKYSDMVNKFDKWEDEDLNNEELSYYIEVSSRVTSKLLEVAY